MRNPDDEVVKLRLALVHVGRQLAGRYLHRLVAFMSHQPALAELLVLQSHVESTTKAACEIEAGWHKLAAAICDEVAAVSADCEEGYGKLARQSTELDRCHRIEDALATLRELLNAVAAVES
jgi:hypothetical protein